MAHPYHPAPVAPKKKRRWLRRVLFAFFLLAVLVWFAPTVVAKSGLRNRLLAYASSDLAGSVTADDASFGWFSPVELRGVVLKDKDGNEYARADRVVTDASLVTLARNPRTFGTVRVEKPVVDLVCGEKETNVETAFAKYFAPSQTPAPDRVSLVVHVSDGTLTLRNPDQTVSHTLPSVSGDVTIPGAKSEPIRVVAQSAGNTPDALAVDMAFGDDNRITLVGNRVPLDVIGLIVKWFEPSTSLGGTGVANVTITWSKDAYGVDGTVVATNFSVGGTWFGPDRLTFAKLDLPAKFTVRGNTLTAEKLNLTCDAGTLSLSGTVDLGGNLDSLADKPGLKAEADLNLTKFAAALPRLFHVRPGTELSGGQLKANVSSATGPGGTVWTGGLSTSSIRAVREGKPVVWEKPVIASFIVRLGADRWPVFDKLEAQSEFIGLAAQGSAEQFKAAATIDLGKLQARLKDFIDLEGVQLAGIAEVRLNSKPHPAGGFEVAANGSLRQFAVVDAQGVGLREPELALTLVATAKKDKGTVRVETGKVTLVAAGDSAEVSLTEPVADVAKLTSGTWRVVAAGDLTHWQDRARPFFSLPPDFALRGRGKLTGIIAVAHKKLGFDGTLTAEPFALGPVNKPTWTEPTLTLAAKGDLDVAADTVRFDRLRVARDGLAVDARGSVYDLSVSQDVRLDGTVAYDLKKLEPKLREFLGKGATVSGTDTRPFRLAGKFGGRTDVVAGLSGAAAVGWQSLKAYGFDVGPADLKADLDAGTVHFSPVAATFGGGQVRVTPSLALRPDAYTLTFAKGKAIDRAKLTPAVCADALGFVLPAIANATQAEGTVSFDLGENRIPLSDTTKAYVKGTLTLHAVKVSPGPVATELATLLGATNVTLTLANEQPVGVRVENGRVYHDSLSLDVRGFAVKTSGSVGFDGSLNLVADMPLPTRMIDQLLADRPILKDALAKRRVSVPVGGTLQKPVVDAKAFQAAVQKLTQDVIKSAADEALKKGFQGLFPKK